MVPYTPHQARYFAEQITLHRSESSIEGLASAMSGVKVDMKPHQVEAALFALKSPLSSGALLADEVGLGKTIEAGLVMAQYWSERRRHILLIMPASLRMQWRTELSEKFFIDSVIIDAKVFNRQRKAGILNPFDVEDKAVICTFEFAAGKETEIRQVPWDLVVIDEAHKLRNVYQKSNVRGNVLKDALRGRRKLLLTATPLQNSLMELYGLTSIIDEHIFGDSKTFKAMYAKSANSEITYRNLRARLQDVCKRTLRRNVAEYVNYTSRRSILQRYEPTPDEQTLYDNITDYLQTDKLYALPSGQRALITMVLRKLLASSSRAICGTLESLIKRLEGMVNGLNPELDMDDFDSFSEYEDDDEGADDSVLDNGLREEKDAITAEINRLRSYADLAKRITNNSKGDKLLVALEEGFATIPTLGGQRKAVIFTESRRTQDYLYQLLSTHGYDGRIVFLNGVNDDPASREIYARWINRHKTDGLISGAKDADLKAAIVEAFRDEASILIGTEAASEGINLQFCSIVVNFDLPWNPQRIEQRIGRCHRYGQKNDVVVINFLNDKNAADKRVYDLLSQKFKLFDGVFGSSDEILGSVESGVDFEKRIARIYQECRYQEDIQREFDKLQEELAEPISKKMRATRQSILDNFDENISSRLTKCEGNTVASLDRFSQWMYYFFLIHEKGRAVGLSKGRLRLTDETGQVMTYNLDWRSAEKNGDYFLRREDSFFHKWLEDEMNAPQLDSVAIRFDYTHETERHADFFRNNCGLKGLLSVDKVIYAGTDGIGSQERLVFTYDTENETDGKLDDDLINTMLELSGVRVDGVCVSESEEFIRKRDELLDASKKKIAEENNAHYLEQCRKLNAYFEDLRTEMEQAVTDVRNQITQKQQALDMLNPADMTLDELLKKQGEISRLQSKWQKMQENLFKQLDMLQNQNKREQEKIRRQLEGRMTTQHIMTIAFEIV